MRHLSDDQRDALPPDVNAEILDELLDRLPAEAHTTIINVLIDARATLGVTAEMMAGRLGSDDPEFAAILSRLYRC